MDYLERDYRNRRMYGYNVDYDNDTGPEIKSESPNAVNIVNKSSGGGAVSATQYNNINIHIHLPENFDKKMLTEVVDQITDSLGATGQVSADSKKGKIMGFWDRLR